MLNYCSIALETGVASLANGSARVIVSKTADEESGSRTEAITAVKLEVENVLEGEGGLRALFLGSSLVSSVSFELIVVYKASSPTTYPHLISATLDDLSYDTIIILNPYLSHSHSTSRTSVSSSDASPGYLTWT